MICSLHASILLHLFTLCHVLSACQQALHHVVTLQHLVFLLCLFSLIQDDLFCFAGAKPGGH